MRPHEADDRYRVRWSRDVSGSFVDGSGMSPRQKFDRYMLVVGIGRHRKLGKLNDSEFRSHVAGVLCLAAQSPRRGYLLISEGVEADAFDIANEAGGQVTAKIAGSAIEKLKRVGILERDEDVGAWFVHDWWDVNPEPRPDPSNAQRQADFRARNAESNDARNADVTTDVTTEPAARNGGSNGESNAESNGPPLPPGPPNPPAKGEAEAGSPRKRGNRHVDQSQPPEALTGDQLAALPGVLEVVCRAWKARGCPGIEPQPRGIGLAMLRKSGIDPMSTALQLEHWLTAGRGQRAPSPDIAKRLGDWIADATDHGSGTVSNVQPISRRQSVVAAQNDWQRFYPEGAA